jgi:hypothetical protein
VVYQGSGGPQHEFRPFVESHDESHCLESERVVYYIDLDFQMEILLCKEASMDRRHTGKWLLLPAVLIALMVVPSAYAQETTAGFQGTIKDPSGAVIAGATVEVSSPALIGARRVQTDAAGNYRLAALPRASTS